MFPKLFSYHSFVLPTYGFLVASGFMTGLMVAARHARKEGLEREQIYNLGVYLVLSGMVGAKLFLVIQEWDYYGSHPSELFSFSTLQSGGIFYGGLLGAIATGLWYARSRGVPFLKFGDVFAPGIALGFAIGRLGCFSAGCCWGEPTTLPWAVTFTDPYSHQVVGVPLNIPVHPTQLYEAAAGAAIFGFLVYQYRRKRFDGQILGWYLLLYPAARFTVEFFRGHAEEAYFWGHWLSDAQTVSLLLAATAVWLLWLGPYRKRRLSPASVSRKHNVTASRHAAKLSSR